MKKLCLEDNQQTLNIVRSHGALFDHALVKRDLRINFPGNLAGIYIKFDSSAPCGGFNKAGWKSHPPPP